MSRGLLGAIERSWSGAPGTVPWTWALFPLALLYASGSALARSRARRTRRSVPGLRVIAVGGLTAGGSGKSTVANWLANWLAVIGARPAVLLRGHRASHASDVPYVVPEFDRYPVSEAFRRGGDEAAAHRGALWRTVPVAVHKDRYASARVVHAGYDADFAILDDGWEQSSLRWDELWVVVDPDVPAGNGAPIPAGSLRRPVSTLREANVVALIYEGEESETRDTAIERIRTWAGDADILRFRRALDIVSPLGTRHYGMRHRGSSPGVEGLGPAGLVSGIGAPERLERFAHDAGIHVVSHAAFPDHASWTSEQIEAAMEAAARKGAQVILTTEKDEARWPASTAGPLSVRVLRTRLDPLDPHMMILLRTLGWAPPAPIG